MKKSREQLVAISTETLELTKDMPVTSYIRTEKELLSQELTQPQLKINTRIRVEDSTTLDSILNYQDLSSELGVLNFASATNPGGGFLRGSMTQEESLAYASNLYHTLIRHLNHYKGNKNLHSGFYLPQLIVSENITFIRDTFHNILPVPIAGVTVISSPAVNSRFLRESGKLDRKNIKLAMEHRMESIIKQFILSGCRTLILGAYGCGVFENDPYQVARTFKNLLQIYNGYFTEVVFAIPKHYKDNNYLIFKEILS